jgi:alkylated DNA repair dioxygenase AlkB
MAAAENRVAARVSRPGGRQWDMPRADLFPVPLDPGPPWQGRVGLHPAWMAGEAAVVLRRRLVDEVPWTVHRIRMFGRWVDSPRLSCWMGDPGVAYRYSGALFEPEPWHPAVHALLPRLEATCGAPFNSVLINRYRDGGDSMGWHSDDEPELGPAPVIASLSLGAERRFLLRMRADPAIKAEWRLADGDLLVMRGDCQRVAQHALPKMARVEAERINLTFRWVDPSR